jgi:hypothetical protein
MPIDHSGNGYLATDAGILVDAFEGALKALRLVDRNDPAALVVANHIITFAKTGVFDPVRLRDLTLEAVRIAATVTDRLASRNSRPQLWVINSFAERDFSQPNRITLTKSCRCNNS